LILQALVHQVAHFISVGLLQRYKSAEIRATAIFLNSAGA